MDVTSRKSALLILGVTALVLSRLLFYFFDDPEGPNLLVVGVMTAFVFGVSWGAYTATQFDPQKKLVLTILLQICTVAILYFLLR